MKKKICILLAAAMVLSCAGCAKAIALTEDEQNLIAEYSSYILIKHSRYNDSLLLSKDDLEKAILKQEEDQKKAEEKKAEEEKDKEKDPNNKDDGGGASGTTPIGEPVSMTEAVGISGLEFTYNGFEVLEEYSESIVTLGDRPGKKYVFLNFNLANTSAEAKPCDMITAKAKFKAVINGTSVAHLPTLLPSDFSTFNKKTSIAAGEKKNVFLVFEVADSVATEIKSLSLSMTKDGNAGAVAIKLS